MVTYKNYFENRVSEDLLFFPFTGPKKVLGIIRG